MRKLSFVAAAWLGAWLVGAATAQPLTTALVYQGELRHAGEPVTTPHDIRFSLWDAFEGGANIGATLCLNNVTPVDGRFAATLDFGVPFQGVTLYLQIEVKADVGTTCADAAGYTPLQGRQQLTIAPYAGYAMHAGTASVSTLLNGQPASFFTNASNLNGGVIPDARLASTVARTNVPQTFTAAITFANPDSSFAGSGSLLTSLNASNLASGFVPDSRLSAAVARRSESNQFVGDQSITGALRINSASSVAPLHVGGEGYFAGAVRVGHTDAPRAGTIRFNQTTRDFEGYNGAWWRSLTATSTSAPEHIVTFTTPGSTTWTVPAGVLSIGIEGWGGGGGGGCSGSALVQDCTNFKAAGGGGGGSGGYGVHIVDVSPGDVVGILVGSGGPGAAAGNGTAGGTTFVTINGFLVIQATGGGGGLAGPNEQLGGSACGTPTFASTGGAAGSCSLANFANQAGNPGVRGRQAWNAGGCGFPGASPDIRPGCGGSAGPPFGSLTPSAASAGQGGVGGQHTGSAVGPGQAGQPGRVRILY